MEEDKSGLKSITSDVEFDPSQIAMIGPGIDEEGQTVGTVMKIDPETGKEDMSLPTIVTGKLSYFTY